ncbi:PREDICTED: leucine-rich repeat-containing protein 23-like isoform X1 [Acropora digitifera]|uniref:leucine-rich repeat-containing protein 23-like isoform X1 n=1 Tax=Acropora digitifera TaxID=70779 RepID=UPI00077ABE77|nr:PREDICTED: leucine-rich repeat-containing protein 23-like isoform X1 [Acropora digitifera]
MSDFEDEEGVDEPVLDDENEDDTQKEEERSPENPLTEEMLADSLSLLCKTGDGLAHAYVRLDIHEKELTDVSILSSFIHLRYVDVLHVHVNSVCKSAFYHLLNIIFIRKLTYLQRLPISLFMLLCP